MRMYPIFTDGKKFYHSQEFNIPVCRMAYFSKLELEEWVKKEKSTLTKEKAKYIYDRWDKDRKDKEVIQK